MAEALYREAASGYPDMPVHHNNFRVLLQRKRQFTDAELCYRRGLALYNALGPPCDAMQTWGNPGLLLAARKRDDEALSAFERMAQFTPFRVEEHSHAIYLEVSARRLRKRQEAAAAERVAATDMRYRVRHAFRQTKAGRGQ